MAGVDGRRPAVDRTEANRNRLSGIGRWNNRIGGLRVGFAFFQRASAPSCLAEHIPAVKAYHSGKRHIENRQRLSRPVGFRRLANHGGAGAGAGIRSFFPPVWDITLEHPPSNVIPLHIMNANNTFLIIINSSVDRGC